MERALGADGDIREGIEATREQLVSILAQEGLSPISSEGKNFDPAVHEALRACLARFTLPLQPPQYQADHRHLDEGLAALHLPLVVLAQTAVSYKPPERPLHDPSMGQDNEAFGIRTTPPFDDLQFPPALLFAPSGQLLSRVGPICPDLQTGHKRL